MICLAVCCLAMPMPCSTEAAPAATDPSTYVVGWGDTLSSIARRYGTTVTAISQANGLHNPNLIYVGQRLAIPGAVSAPTASSGVYVVQRGDTLAAIAGRYGTTVQNLAQLNGLTNPNFIVVGQRLAVPSEQPTTVPRNEPAQSTVYVVQRVIRCWGSLLGSRRLCGTSWLPTTSPTLH